MTYAAWFVGLFALIGHLFLVISAACCDDNGWCNLDCHEFNLNILTDQVNIMNDYVNFVERNRFEVENVASPILARKLDSVDGGPCPKNMFSCGGSTGQCVPLVSVCDRTTDCVTGLDESSKTCGFLPEEGAIYKVNVVHNRCLKEHEKVLLDIHGYIYDWYTPRPMVKTILSMLDTMGPETLLYSKELVLPYYHGTRQILLNFENIELKFTFQPENNGVKLEGTRFPDLENPCYLAEGVRMCQNCVDNVIVCKRDPNSSMYSYRSLRCVKDIKAPPKSQIGLED